MQWRSLMEFILKSRDALASVMGELSVERVRLALGRTDVSGSPNQIVVLGHERIGRQRGHTWLVRTKPTALVR